MKTILFTEVSNVWTLYAGISQCAVTLHKYLMDELLQDFSVSSL